MNNMFIAVVTALTLGFAPAAFADEKAPKFEDHPAAVVQITVANLNLTKDGDLWKYRSRIQEGVAEAKGQPNFAGHYILITWGCGSPCWSGVIVDTTTGVSHWLPVTPLGYDFRADSTLLVANPDVESNTSFGEAFSQTFYVWDEEVKEFKLIATLPPPVE